MKKLKELINYGIVGLMTTGINYAIFIALIDMKPSGLIFANTIAWIGAVLFAYFANKKYVFKTKGNKKVEISKFFGLRLVTLLIENGLLVMLVDNAGLNTLLSKILVSVATIIGNYVFCKYSVFKDNGPKDKENHISNENIKNKEVQFNG